MRGATQVLALALFAAGCAGPGSAEGDAEPVLRLVALDSVEVVTQWTPVEWAVGNPEWRGNPFDLEARVLFRHEESGEEHDTGMFFDGDGSWRFRFTGTRPGLWRFATRSEDPDLDGVRGAVEVAPAPDGTGFVRGRGNRWARQHGVSGELRAYLPQLLMYRTPADLAADPALVRRDIRTFLRDHGFTGFHVPVLCRWFDIELEECSAIESSDPTPDPRTFRALERLIREVHGAGGTVHLWAWGDESRGQTPARWGLNGPADRRLQRYIAARLGPLPGWTMGYGFDVWEWVDPAEVRRWHDQVHAELGWPHLLGARGHTGSLEPFASGLDYIGYEQHRPGYLDYVAAMEADTTRPAFSEDRFRIREDSPYPEKDYDMESTRRGLWRSAMAGGVANIWGNRVARPGQDPGLPAYPRPEWIRTYARFFADRFTLDLHREAAGPGIMALASRDGERLIVYVEDADSVPLPPSGRRGAASAVAVDARAPYREINLGVICVGDAAWHAPRRSDWAVVVGDTARSGHPGEADDCGRRP